MSRPRAFTPLRSWALALALTLPILAPLLIPTLKVEPAVFGEPDEYRYRHELAAYLATAPEKRQRPTGVMLAMSGGSCATIGPLRLSSDGADLYVVYFPSARLSYFHRLADDLVQAKPDFVVVQDAVLTRPVRPVVGLYRRARSYWANRIYGLAGWQDTRQADEAHAGNWKCPLRAPQSDDWDEPSTRVHPFSERHQKFVVAFLTKFSKAKVPVIVASPPANEVSAQYRRKVYRLAHTLISHDGPLHGVTLHRQSALTPKSHFSDPTHLLPQASGPYRTWLNGEIMRVIRKRADEQPS